MLKPADQSLSELKANHNALCKEVAELERRPGACSLEIAVLKRKKLLLKTEIERRSKQSLSQAAE